MSEGKAMFCLGENKSNSCNIRSLEGRYKIILVKKLSGRKIVSSVASASIKITRINTLCSVFSFQ